MVTKEEEIDWLSAGRGVESGRRGVFQLYSTTWPSLLLPHIFQCGQLRFLVVLMMNNDFTPGEMNPRGMLAVFMQPDPSLDEDEYAPRLKDPETYDLRLSGSMSGTTMSSMFQNVSLRVTSSR